MYILHQVFIDSTEAPLQTLNIFSETCEKIEPFSGQVSKLQVNWWNA